MGVAIVSVCGSPGLGQGYNGFAPLEPVSSVGSSRGIAAADFDGDGDFDFAVSADFVGPTGRLYIVRNNGLGVLVVSNEFTIGSLPQDPEVGDFNGDGYADIVVPNVESDTFALLRGNGDGTFQPVATFPTIDSPRDIATADFDGDGRLDIAVTSRIANQVRTHLSTGSGFLVGTTISTPFSGRGIGPGRIAAGDLNDDGNPDIVVACGSSQELVIYYGSGSGFFIGEFAIYRELPDMAFDVQMSDMDDDGDLDLVASYASKDASIAWLRSASSSGEVFPDFNDGFFPTHVGGRLATFVVANIDCGPDAFPDVLGINEILGFDGLHPFTNPGTGALVQRPTPELLSVSPTGVVGADVDGDGDIDAVINDLAGDVRVYLNRCLGRNCPADLNADGTLDFFDVSAFIVAFTAQDPLADLAAPAGSWDFFDVSEYIVQFTAGCP